MPRNKAGFLKADALRNGIPDQYAVDKGGARHVVEIRHDTYLYGGFATLYTVTRSPDDWETTTTQFADDLPAAREDFKRWVKSLGGRA